MCQSPDTSSIALIGQAGCCVSFPLLRHHTYVALARATSQGGGVVVVVVVVVVVGGRRITAPSAHPNLTTLLLNESEVPCSLFSSLLELGRL